MTSSSGSDRGLSSAIVAFVELHFQSIRQLEVLLWLLAHRERAWSAEEIARELRCNKGATARWLEGFRAANFLVEEPQSEPKRYRYETALLRTDELLTTLAAEYKLRPLRVVDAIVNQPTKRMMDLMDAFRFSKGDNDDDG